jgi:hypothetical protein
VAGRQSHQRRHGEIDRDKHTIVADGNVVTEAWEQPKDDQKKKTTAPPSSPKCMRRT